MTAFNVDNRTPASIAKILKKLYSEGCVLSPSSEVTAPVLIGDTYHFPDFRLVIDAGSRKIKAVVSMIIPLPEERMEASMWVDGFSAPRTKEDIEAYMIVMKKLSRVVTLIEKIPVRDIPQIEWAGLY